MLTELARRTNYNGGASCTINVTFMPKFAGSRYGAVVLQDGSGNVLATTTSRVQAGPADSFPAGYESAVPTSALASPSGVAVAMGAATSISPIPATTVC